MTSSVIYYSIHTLGEIYIHSYIFARQCNIFIYTVCPNNIHEKILIPNSAILRHHTANWCYHITVQSCVITFWRGENIHEKNQIWRPMLGKHSKLVRVYCKLFDIRFKYKKIWKKDNVATY